MSLTILEYEPETTMDMRDEAEAENAVLNNRIEALKTLALALLSEIGSLEKSRSREPEAKLSLQEEVRRFEADMIRCALIRTGGRQRRAARILGVNAATLNAKIKRYRIRSEIFVNNSFSPLRGTK